MEIRPLRVEDIAFGFLEALGALRPPGLTAQEAERLYIDIQCDKSIHPPQIIVAIEDGQVVGTATVIMERKFLHRAGWVAHIEDVSVNPAYHGKGVGTKLMEYLIDQAKHRGCYKVILDCEEKTIPFYEKLGFYESERHMRLDLQ